MTRHVLVLLHRWVGLAIAAFLILAGLTGALIAWTDALDEWLNPTLHLAATAGPPLSPFDLARMIEQRDPHAEVTTIRLHPEPGHTQSFGVTPRLDPGGQPHALAYTEIFLDPATGREAGRRNAGQAWPVTRQTLMPFLYTLHYSLQAPAFWGIGRWGTWFMGAVALLWTADCFVGLLLTFPRRAARPTRAWLTRWAPAWTMKRTRNPHRITVDLHRAASLWTWAALLVLAFTGFAMNLYTEAFQPAVARLLPLTPAPTDARTPTTQPALPLQQALALAQAEATRRAWTSPPTQITYRPAQALYDIRFTPGTDPNGPSGAGGDTLTLDATTGAVLAAARPWQGTAGDILLQAQFPLHSGRLAGLPGRILVSAMGVAVAMLSITGILIWWRKRTARHRTSRGRVSISPPPA